MKTILMSSCFLNGQDEFGSQRLDRTIRWLGHNRFSRLIYDECWLIDNSSDPRLYWELGEINIYNEAEMPLRTAKKGNISLLRCRSLLAGAGKHEYPYCWRALWFARELIERHDVQKIIFMDTDCFLLSRKIMDYINTLRTGWQSFWVPKYGFPSTECHVLCDDAFPIFMDYTKEHWSKKVGETMEIALPFTQVNKNFNCDRFGEDAKPQEPEMDAYFQARVITPLHAEK